MLIAALSLTMIATLTAATLKSLHDDRERARVKVKAKRTY